MKEWWGEFNHPFVKGATGLAVALFLALNLPVVLLVFVAAVLCYVAVRVGVAYGYRNRHAIAGKSELAVRFAWRTFSGLRERCSRMVVDALEGHERRKLVKREKEERLRRYKLERNRRKRERARTTPAQDRPLFGPRIHGHGLLNSGGSDNRDAR